MCLITVAKTNNVKNTFLNTKGLIDSVFSQNPDGLGVMWSDGKKLHVHKMIPKSIKEARAFVEDLPDSDNNIVIHWRMQTHGLVDIDNCHPYKVHSDTYLAHNGVLQTGNDSNTNKSDTWHFIDRYLRHIPADTLHNPQFAELLGMAIGGNCFVIMSADGRLTIVNKNRGMEVNGIWFSNTYAWDVSLLVPDWHKKNNYWFGFDYDGLITRNRRKSKPNNLKKFVSETINEGDADYLALLIEEQPERVIRLVLDNYKISAGFLSHDLSFSYFICVKAWVEEDYDELCILGTANPQLVAEALLYYCDLSNERSLI